MSNTEKITCDYLGCRQPYSYRWAGFNLCAKHLHEGEEKTANRLAAAEKILARRLKSSNESSNKISSPRQ